MNSCHTSGMGCAQCTHNNGRETGRAGVAGMPAGYPGCNARSLRLHRDARRLQARGRYTYMPQVYAGRLCNCVQCHGNAARQACATAMPVEIGGAWGLLWDLQCALRVYIGVIWGRRHLRVALEICSLFGLWCSLWDACETVYLIMLMLL